MIQNRIDTIVHRIDKACGEGLRAGHLASIREIVEYELRYQDKETRHACAEAMNLDLIQNNAFMPAVEVLNRAHQACMNASSI